MTELTSVESKTVDRCNDQKDPIEPQLSSEDTDKPQMEHPQERWDLPAEYYFG